MIDRAALGTLHTGLSGWAFAPDFPPLGVLLLVGAALNLWRLIRWRGAATAAEPLLLVLHVGYAWTVFGAALLGLSMLSPDVPLTAAVHALTAGAIGTMTLAVMTRATRGHTGRKLSADNVTSTIYVLVNLAAVMRVAAATKLWLLTDLVRVIEDWEASPSLKINGETMVGRLPPIILIFYGGSHAARFSNPYPGLLNIDRREPTVCRDDKHRRSR